MARQNVQLCAPMDLGHLRRVIDRAGFVYVQPKLKGIHLLWDGRELLTAQGNRLPALCHIDAALSRRFPGVPLEGELYLHGLSEAQINGLAHRAEPDAETATLRMHIFDIADPKHPAEKRLSFLEGLSGKGPLHFVEIMQANTEREVRRWLAWAEANGFEGIVVRDPQALWQPGKHLGVMKWKPRHYDQYEIVAVIGGSDGLATALKMRDAEGSQFSVGGLRLTKPERQRLLDLRDQAIGKTAWVSYCGADEDGHHAARVEKILDLPGLADRPGMHLQVDLPEDC